VRAVIIETLREKSAEAAVRFSDLAGNAENPKTRKRAFVCLRLLESRNAKEAVIQGAVIQGLTDTDPSVRIAAAYNAGLYPDIEFIRAFESFLERSRWSIAMEMVREAVRSVALIYLKMEHQLMRYLLYGGLNSRTKKA